MPNVPLAYVSVHRRMSDIFHTLAYASTIRNSVTGPLTAFETGIVKVEIDRKIRGRCHGNVAQLIF
jgi:hypothetical protein